MNTLYKYLNDILIAHRETFESLFDSEDDFLRNKDIILRNA